MFIPALEFDLPVLFPAPSLKYEHPKRPPVFSTRWSPLVFTSVWVNLTSPLFSLVKLVLLGPNTDAAGALESHGRIQFFQMLQNTHIRVFKIIKMKRLHRKPLIKNFWLSKTTPVASLEDPIFLLDKYDQGTTRAASVRARNDPGPIPLPRQSWLCRHLRDVGDEGGGTAAQTEPFQESSRWKSGKNSVHLEYLALAANGWEDYYDPTLCKMLLWDVIKEKTHTHTG